MTSHLLFCCGLLVCWFFCKKKSFFIQRYNAKVTHSFCKASCCSWRNPSGLAVRAKHSPLTHEKTLQDHGEPLLPCTVFPNVDCRFPFCGTCPYIWFQTGLLGPRIDWILHAFLNFAFNWIQLHPWHQSSLKPSRASFWPSGVKSRWCCWGLSIWQSGHQLLWVLERTQVLQLMRMALQSHSSQKVFCIFTFLSY